MTIEVKAFKVVDLNENKAKIQRHKTGFKIRNPRRRSTYVYLKTSSSNVKE